MMNWCPDWGPFHVMGRDWVSEREEKEKGGNKRKEGERERDQREWRMLSVKHVNRNA